MAYTTIFMTKPKKENKVKFCKRIVDLLNEIQVVTSEGDIINGWKMLNHLFKYEKINMGYSNIDDLLSEADDNFCNIYELCTKDEYWMTDNELLSNIEIIINCFYTFKDNEYKYGYFNKKENSLKNIEILFNAVRAFLLSNGYKLVKVGERLSIIENEMAIDIEEIENKKLKEEIINFYDYKNASDLEEKKKTILILIGKLENRKKDIGKLLGAKVADIFSNYANNLNLRHNNVSEEYKKYYNKKVAELNEEEIIKWYDYVFAFMINIYMNLNKIKDININNGYK